MQQLNDTAHKILDIAEHYTQTRGFNAFSYKDIQNEVGIKTSSIHYYFPTKKDLALSMTVRYVENFSAKLLEISDKYSSAIEQIEQVAQIYVGVVKQNKFCMCGMLASEFLSICDTSISKLGSFFDLVQNWIEKVIILGQQQKVFKHSISAKDSATSFVSVTEGAMLIARVKGDADYLTRVINNTIKALKT